nr:glycoside hydrolase family 3 N-terminal domain-containing protein [Clostridium beijerinckii]
MVLASCFSTATHAAETKVFPKYYEKKYIKEEDKATISEKVEALIKTMTEDEKLEMLGGNKEKLDKNGAAGYMVGVPRLGVPEIKMHDGPAGVTSIHETTGLPTGMVLGSTWSTDEAKKYGEVLGSDNVSQGGNWQLGTQLDVSRIPQWSRSKDTFGEDPYLNGTLGTAEVEAVQNTGAAAMIKHFAGYGSNGDFSASVTIDEQTLHEIYGTSFEKAIKEGDAASLMTSYNKVNGKWMSANDDILLGILRDQWKFDGPTCNDWGGNHEFDVGLGNDIEMPSKSYNSPDAVRAAIKAGTLTWDQVNNAIRHTLTAMGKVGYLSLVKIDPDTGLCIEEPGRTDPIALKDTYDEDVNSDVQDRNNQIAEEVAEKGAVLLKNDNNALPLANSDYAGDNKVSMIGLGAMNLISGIGGERSYGVLKYMQSPYEAVSDMIGNHGNSSTTGAAVSTVEGKVGLDVVGTTIPVDYIYQSAIGTEHGWIRVDNNNSLTTTSESVIESDDTSDSETTTSAAVTTTTDDAVTITTDDAVTTTTNAAVTIDNVIDFTTGTKDYKNGPNGTAFANGEDYTWTGYLEAPESGEYTLTLESIGGTTNAKIQLTEDGNAQSIGSSSSRQGSQWGWSNIVSTKEGMDINSNTFSLEQGKRYKITVTGIDKPSDLQDDKDLQLRMAWITPSQKKQNYEEAVAAASDSKTVVFFAWHNTSAGAGQTSNTDSIALPSDQLDLLKDVSKAVKANNGKLIVVLNTSDAISYEGDWLDDADAVLQMYYPGQAGGKATANLLLGKVNPSGKLTQTEPMKDTDTLVTDSEEDKEERGGKSNGNGSLVDINYSEGIYTGYRWYDKEEVTPAFDFGHGLSYTTFEYSDLKIKENDNNGFDATFTVKNTGDVTGSEVAQVYLGEAQVPSGVQMAKEQLAGFARIENLNPGESKQVTVTINQRSLSYWDTNSTLITRADGTQDKWKVATGERKVMIGSASDDIRLEDNIDVKDTTSGGNSSSGSSHHHSSGSSSSSASTTSDSNNGKPDSTEVAVKNKWSKNSDGTWSFINSNGEKATGWVQDGNNWYRLDTSGKMQTGWIKDTDGTWYYLSNNGAMSTGWLKDTDGKWYYLNSNGAMKTGWLEDTDGRWYYLNSDGSMKTGWFKDADGKWYYFNNSGDMATNTTIDGFEIDSTGAWIS